MTVANRKSREWHRMRGRLPPEDMEAILAMWDRLGQRDGETEADWLARLKRQNQEFMTEMDRLAAEEEAEQG